VEADGDAALLPERVFDDGTSAYLSWPQGAICPPFWPATARPKDR
jgi:type IV secretory pathway VirB9-like protein